MHSFKSPGLSQTGDFSTINLINPTPALRHKSCPTKGGRTTCPRTEAAAAAAESSAGGVQIQTENAGRTWQTRKCTSCDGSSFPLAQPFICPAASRQSHPRNNFTAFLYIAFILTGTPFHFISIVNNHIIRVYVQPILPYSEPLFCVAVTNSFDRRQQALQRGF